MSFKKIIYWFEFLLLCMPIIIGPWLFASWEMWFFWPMVLAIFLSSALFSLRLIGMEINSENHLIPRNGGSLPKLIKIIIGSYVVFLLYAVVRAFTSDVFMDAERSYLLFLTPLLISIQILFGFNKKRYIALIALICINLAALGAYGIINHLAFDNKYVMWLPGEPQYQQGCLRATGSFVCPNHFSGMMEIALCLGIGFIMVRSIQNKLKISAIILMAIAMTGIILSKSRGGGLTVLALLIVIMLFGARDWTRQTRFLAWIGTLGTIIAASLFLSLSDNAYSVRFQSFFKDINKGSASIPENVTHWAGKTSRGTMIISAVNAWRETPKTMIIGIGAGMHQHLWPHYAASSDGDKENYRWPSSPNYTFHSYEVHSDWVQLLEEYGIIGLVLFLVPFAFVIAFLYRASRSDIHPESSTFDMTRALCISGLFAVIAIAFHSLGDFNMQMPATVWMLTAIVTIPAGLILRNIRNS